MLDRDKIVAAFARALDELDEEGRAAGVRPRTVAVRAHEIYCSGLRSFEKRPVLETFRKFATGRLALPEVVDLLEATDIRPVVRTRLDRGRLRSVFEEAIQRLETRLLKGQVKPLQIARRAHQIYTRDADDEAPQPSHHTFERLIYGKTADPEVMSLIDSALKRKGEES